MNNSVIKQIKCKKHKLPWPLNGQKNYPTSVSKIELQYMYTNMCKCIEKAIRRIKTKFEKKPS